MSRTIATIRADVGAEMSPRGTLYMVAARNCCKGEEGARRTLKRCPGVGSDVRQGPAAVASTGETLIPPDAAEIVDCGREVPAQAAVAFGGGGQGSDTSAGIGEVVPPVDAGA